MAERCQAELIAVGSEILLGQISNSHAQFISQEFAKYGFFIYHHSAVGDNQSRIEQSFAQATSRSNVVIVTGGLGPTVDDLTKESLASFLHLPLELSLEALADLEQYFHSRNRSMPKENLKQAYCIQGGELLHNPNGTAPGQYIFAAGVHYFLLPGPPMEMRPMLLREVIPRLQRIFGAHQVVVSRVLHFCGIGESSVDEQVTDLTSGVNPTVAPLASEGEMLLRITATDVSEALARKRIEPIEIELRSRFAQYIYGVDDESLSSVIGKYLRSNGATLAVAESCTGGLLGAMITGIPGASTYFKGGALTYENPMKEKLLGVSRTTLVEQGAVSEETAEQMAKGVRALCESTYGLAITGIAGPDGGTTDKPVGLVYVGLAGPRGTQVFRIQQKGSREQIRVRSAKHALWRLWLELTWTDRAPELGNLI